MVKWTILESSGPSRASRIDAAVRLVMNDRWPISLRVPFSAGYWRMFIIQVAGGQHPTFVKEVKRAYIEMYSQ